MFNPIQAIFADKLEFDNREPVLTFETPLFDGTYGLLAPNLMFWIQLLIMILVQGAFIAATSVLMYELIVRRRGSTSSYLFGFGVVIPFWIVFPYFIIPMFDIRNMVLKFVVSAILPTLIVFKCLEAMYGFCPLGVERSSRNYALYNASPMEVIYEPVIGVPVKVSRNESLRHIKWFGIYMVILGAYISVISPYMYEPFEPVPSSNDFMGHKLSDLFHGGQIKNNFVAAVLFQLYLTTFAEGLAAATNIICGVQTKPVMDNPVFMSTSPSDFWGRRWNTVVHGVLKRGVFQPVRQYLPRYFATAAAFLASGLFHEWVLTVICFIHEHEKGIDHYEPVHGRTLAFFLWNAVLIILENTIGCFWVFHWTRKNLPRPLVSLIVISAALPVAHWMVIPYIKSGFFQNGQIGFPMLVKVG